jgi:hypothetical protein
MQAVLQAELDILRYLIAHLDARDTIEGIEKWWLPQERRYGLADIAAALTQLEDNHLVRVWTSTSARPVYGRDATPEALSNFLEILVA